MPTFQGNNIQEAIDNGLATLKLGRDEVTVEVIAEGKKGILGLGKKPAVINVNPISQEVEPELATIQKAMVAANETSTAAQQPAAADQPSVPATGEAAPHKVVRDDETATQKLVTYLSDVTRVFGAPSEVNVEKQASGRRLIFHLTTEKEGLLIGRHGRTINALQYLAQTDFNHQGKSKVTVVLNVGDYRQRREVAVSQLATHAAREVIATGQAIHLAPMPANERKRVHAQLNRNSHVQTFSEGKDPHRYVVVAPKTL